MRKVLIADDEHNIRNILDFSLHAEGFDVVAARNGDDAFTLALGEQPDLIILDVMMPGTNGYRDLPPPEGRTAAPHASPWSS